MKLESSHILIVDDHLLFREGLKALLEPFYQKGVIEIAHNGNEALLMMEKFRPDIILTDIDMPGLNGIELIKKIKEREPNIPVIALSMHTRTEYITGMLNNGCRGYLIKSAPVSEVKIAIDSVLKNESYIPEQFATVLAEHQNASSIRITNREKEVLKLICEGFTNKEIAQQLKIGTRTVETHRANLLLKTGSRSIASLIRFALEQNFQLT